MTLAASPGGVLFYGGSAVAGWQLAWFGKEGKRLGTLGEPGSYSSFGLSRDGRRAVVTRAASTTEPDLWMVDIERGVWSRFTFTPSTDTAPVWSADGRTVVFRSGAPGNLYRKEAGGAGTEQRIIESANPQAPMDWSRDGQLLLFSETAPETRLDVWVLPVTADGKPEAGGQARPYLRTRFNEHQPRFSPEPNPRWVAYQSDESGRDEVYIQSFPEPRGKWPISTSGGRFPRWSPDSRELFYMAPDDKLMAVSLKLGTDSVEASVPRELFTIGWNQIVPGSPYEVAPDGQRFLVRAATESGSQPLQVIVNWPALLKKGAQ
jgi:Tol biopolymer transport system component